MRTLLGFLAAICCIQIVLATSQTDLYSQRVQDWFLSETDGQVSTEDAAANEDSVTELSNDSAQEIIKSEDQESTADSLSTKFYKTFISVLERIIVTSVGWSIGVSIPVGILAIAIAYSKYRQRKELKTQEKILADTLASRRRQSIEDNVNVINNQSEISPVPQEHT